MRFTANDDQQCKHTQETLRLQRHSTGRADQGTACAPLRNQCPLQTPPTTTTFKAAAVHLTCEGQTASASLSQSCTLHQLQKDHISVIAVRPMLLNIARDSELGTATARQQPSRIWLCTRVPYQNLKYNYLLSRESRSLPWVSH